MNIHQQKTNIWFLLFLLLPATTFAKLSTIFQDKDNLVYTLILTSIGLSLGYLFYYLTKKKSLILKIGSLVSLIIFPFLFLVLSQENEVEKEWLKQEINSISFTSPEELKLIESEIPQRLENYFSKIEVFNDNAKNKTTLVYSIGLIEPDIDLEDFFEQYLKSVQNIIPNLNSTEIIDTNLNQNRFNAGIKFIIDEKELDGYCRIIQNGNNLTMFWLIPVKESYSEEYIMKFDSGISRSNM